MNTPAIQDDAMRQDNRRVYLVTNIPTPYRIPLFNEVSRQLAAHGFTLQVVFAAAGYPRRKWQIPWEDCEFEYVVLRGGQSALAIGEGMVFPYGGLLRQLRRQRAAVVIATGFSIGTLKVWLNSLCARTPYILWSGSVANAHRRVSTLRSVQRRFLVKQADGFISYGSASQDYLVSLGAERSQCHIAINTVDTAFFRDEADRWRTLLDPMPRNELLYIGNLTAGKRIDLLLEAAAALLRRRSDFMLRIVGDGPERDRLERLASDLNISDLVFFDGFRQRDEIPRYHAAARCFLFPSEYDVWGLVLVEAMAAGVPCIASIHAGATVDLIEDGRTGFALKFAHTEAVVDRIEWLLAHPAKADRIGQAAKEFIQHCAQLEVSAKGVVDAVLQTVRRQKQAVDTIR